jgi:ATP-binding cassette, subfamily B, bacterial
MNTTRQTLSIFWRFTRPYKSLFWGGTIGAALGVIAQDVIPPFIISRAFVKLQLAAATHQPLQLEQLLPYVVGVTVSLLAGVLFWRLQGYAVWLYEIRTIRDLFVAVFNHIAHQGQKFHADRFGGALVSQATKFASGYEKLIDEFTWSIVSGLTALLASTAVLFVVSYKFALLLLAIVGIYLVIMTWRVRKQFPYNHREAEADSSRTAALADAITNIGNIRAFAREDYELQRFTAAADRAKRTFDELAMETFKNDSISHSMTNTLRITAFAFGVFAVTHLGAKASVLYLVVSYAGSVVDRLWQFGRIIRHVNHAFGDSAEMTRILQLPPEIADPKNPEPVRIDKGAIDFVHVRFAHDAGEDRANAALFEDLSLHIEPGEKIGLVGSSGSGKTTLTGLLLRFMDVDGGEILIDGQNIAHIRQADLRDQIAYVQQEPLLFHRTIGENIGYGDLGADQKAIVASLPLGYDTLVGERGVKLSGGQRQRVAIARAMLKNAPILVLDEATSALDSESEVLIQDALWQLMEHRTAIVIAHRLSTIQKMDRIVVLQQGQIVEQGSHKQLLAKNGTYAKLWAHQSGGFIEE